MTGLKEGGPVPGAAATQHGTAEKPESSVRYGSAERRQKITARLRSVAGHVRGIERMVDDGAYCVDVMRQILAIQKAMDRINAMVLEDHLEHCATKAIRSHDSKERERTIAELLEVFEMSSKL